jgi:hypothetical protein
VKEIKNPDLAALLAAAAAPEPNPDERGLEAVLVAYRAAPFAGPDHAPSASPSPRRRPMPGGLLLKFAAAVMLFVAGGVTAASVGALPDPIQRIAHDYLGGVGVPAPPRASVSPSAGASASPSRSRTPSAPLSAAPDASSSAAASLTPSSSTSASASPSPSAASNELVTLCRIVVQTGKGWQSQLDKAQRMIVVKAAGAPPKVLPYCTGLLNGSPANGTNSTPATPSATPSPTTSKKQGGGKNGQSSGSDSSQD